MLFLILGWWIPGPLQATISPYEEEFLKAAIDGNLDFLETYRSSGGDLHVRDDKGNHLGHYAAGNNQPQVIAWCAKYNVDLDLENKEGYTPFLLATLYGHLDAMQKLKDQRVKVKATHKKHGNALHIAVRQKDQKTTKWLLDHTNLSLNLKGGHSLLTPFVMGISSLDVKWIEFLLLHQGNPRQKTDLGLTLVNLLLRNYVIRKNQLEAERREAREENAPEEEIEQFLEQQSTLLEKTKQVITLLVTAEKSLLEERDVTGGTPFLFATAYCEIEFMELLLTLGANPEARTTHGQSAYAINGMLLAVTPKEMAQAKKEVEAFLEKLHAYGPDDPGGDSDES